jgi:hypothetical protein
MLEEKTLNFRQSRQNKFFHQNSYTQKEQNSQSSTVKHQEESKNFKVIKQIRKKRIKNKAE